MMGKTWPALQSCKHKCYKANDQLSYLPDDLLLLIMSFLTMKEAARTCVLSHRWNYLWHYIPVLTFEDYPAMRRMLRDDYAIPQERAYFLRWVNRVLEAHLGWSMDELKVIFDLDKSCQYDIDKWVRFAITKQVKRLELNFTPLHGMYNDFFPKWRMSIDPLHPPAFNSCLHSLCLRYINVTSKDINCLLHSCMVLENLCIDHSQSLKYIRAFHKPLQLKHLEVSWCPRLRAIDILAPKLLSFTLDGRPKKVHIRNATLLSKVSVGDLWYIGDFVMHITESLSKYFSQLEYLSWRVRLYEDEISDPSDSNQFNLGINNPPAMTNLKHLELDVFATSEQSLLGWADLIEASPLLQRLTVKFFVLDGKPLRKIVRRNGRPLKSLKILELRRHIGLPIDLEFATYVIENSVMLKDVIVEIEPLLLKSDNTSVQDQVANLMRIVPHSVNLTLKLLDV